MNVNQTFYDFTCTSHGDLERGAHNPSCPICERNLIHDLKRDLTRVSIDKASRDARIKLLEQTLQMNKQLLEHQAALIELILSKPAEEQKAK